MKNLTISLVASWLGTIRTFQDGDIFRESNIDLHSGDVADRLGYLKTALDGKVALAGNNTYTGDQIFSPATLTPTLFNEGIQFRDDGSGAAVRAGIYVREGVLPDTNGTVISSADTFRVPAITANRTYDMGAASGRRRIRVVRYRTADAFTVTVRDNLTHAVVGVIPASQQGFLEMEFDATATPNWRPVGWSSNVTSLATT